MVTIPPDVGRIMIRGLTREIDRQEAIGKVCGDDWPDDYDPNDVAIYRGFRKWLEERSTIDAVIDHDFGSKPVRFVMGLIPHFVRGSLEVLSELEVNAAARTYSQYVASRCRDMLVTKSEHTSYRAEVLRLLESLIQFPQPTDATGNDAKSA
jgi:hypothetical protein